MLITGQGAAERTRLLLKMRKQRAGLMNGGKPVQIRLIMAVEKPEALHKLVYFCDPCPSVSQLSSSGSGAGSYSRMVTHGPLE